jgi:hypothetical protein
MAALPIDTLKRARRLEAAGFLALQIGKPVALYG